MSTTQARVQRRAKQVRDIPMPPAAMAVPEPSQVEPDLRERVAMRAYELHQLRGGHPGYDQEDWYQAEREILGFTVEAGIKPTE